MIKSLFKIPRRKKIERLDTTSILKDFLISALDYVEGTNEMLDSQEKETKNNLERLYITANNPQQNMIDNLDMLINIAIKDVKRIEEQYLIHNNQYTKVKEMLDNYDIRKEHNKLFAVSASFKELASLEQWKGREYKKYFNNTVTFISDFDEKYFHEIIFNGHYKKELLQRIKTEMLNYGFNYDSVTVEAFEKEIKESSKLIRNMQINFEKLVKNLKK